MQYHLQNNILTRFIVSEKLINYTTNVLAAIVLLYRHCGVLLQEEVFSHGIGRI